MARLLVIAVEAAMLGNQLRRYRPLTLHALVHWDVVRHYGVKLPHLERFGLVANLLTSAAGIVSTVAHRVVRLLFCEYVGDAQALSLGLLVKVLEEDPSVVVFAHVLIVLLFSLESHSGIAYDAVPVDALPRVVFHLSVNVP